MIIFYSNKNFDTHYSHKTFIDDKSKIGHSIEKKKKKVVNCHEHLKIIIIIIIIMTHTNHLTFLKMKVIYI